jgi:hypothetical protein
VADQAPKPRSARRCPDCKALGILPLAQPHTPDGGIQDPLLICPVCDNREFRAIGVKWLGAFPKPTESADEHDAALSRIAEQMAPRAQRAVRPDGG